MALSANLFSYVFILFFFFFFEVGTLIVNTFYSLYNLIDKLHIIVRHFGSQL